MSNFMGVKKETVVLMSPLSMKVTANGDPLKNVRVHFHLSWNDDKIEKTYQTDDSGVFSIPEFSEELKTTPLNRLVINQDITVEVGGSKYDIWIMSKTSKHLYGELGGKPKGITCDIHHDIARVEIGSGILGTQCKWKSIEPLK